MTYSFAAEFFPESFEARYDGEPVVAHVNNTVVIL